MKITVVDEHTQEITIPPTGILILRMPFVLGPCGNYHINGQKRNHSSWELTPLPNNTILFYSYTHRDPERKVMKIRIKPGSNYVGLSWIL